MNTKQLFDAIRKVKGSPLTQADVDLVNAALSDEIVVVGGRRCSPKGIELIHSFESYRGTTYKDPGPTGLPITGGWGTTRDENGEPFKLGFTREQAYWDRLFARDLDKFEKGVAARINHATQAQFDALVSLAYNIGLGNFERSTLLKKHNAGDYAGAKAEFARWNRAGGKILKGLTRRRAAEAALYAS